jgi:hypothetical protein
MTRQSKNYARIVAARKRSAERKNGNKGPTTTMPLHGKKNAWWQGGRSYKDFVSGPKKKQRQDKDQAE